MEEKAVVPHFLRGDHLGFIPLGLGCAAEGASSVSWGGASGRSMTGATKKTDELLTMGVTFGTSLII